jgi:hypothetical protein
MAGSEHDSDVVGVGARCTGAATGMLPARPGYRVTRRGPGPAFRATRCPRTASPAAAHREPATRSFDRREALA